MTIAYLDPDDEITSAVARLRASDDIRVALVLPAGSRIATSRINFRLLAHEAREHQRRLAIVAAEPGVRQVAISAGLPAYGTVADYETALAEGRTEGAAPPGGAAAGAAAAAGAVAGAAGGAAGAIEDPAAGTPELASTVALPAAAAAEPATGQAIPGAGAARSGAAGLPVVGARVSAGGGRRGAWALVSLGLLVAIVLVVGAGLFLLPSATITVTPRTEATGPVNLTVIADPGATEVDTAAGVVPAQTVEVPLSANGEFQATGKKTNLAKATGTVTFTSRNTGRTVPIPAGTQVSTGSGIAFVTTKDVVVPKAVFLPPTPGQANAPIQAVTAGPEGNVPAGSITRVSSSIQALLVNGSDPVTNAQPTSGGARSETQVVSQKDYDDATKTLMTSLKAQLDGAVADPATAPAGATLIPATASVGTVAADPSSASVVGKEQASFVLALTATGTVNAVSEAQLEQVASERLKSSVPKEYTLFPESIQASVGSATVTDGKITVPVEASGQMARQLDQAALLAQVKGKTVAEANAILGPYGSVTIDTWPFYVSSIPTLDGRVTLTVVAPQSQPQPSAS
ncbi:MAG TPA: baseplate J/gp47 family protein [Candidatus Dormibacteraeota bacterium]|nr:baseplate J/gp47 family protein [Candidatus Dormibacteraeota bacterium]